LSEPRLYVVSAPSGGGKTSLIAALLERDDRIHLSVSHTTRQPRPGEIDGRNYHFVDETTFLRLVDEGAFLEYARVFGHWYGTGRQAVTEQLEAGFDVVLDIDWQGARQIRQNFPTCRSIFIVPPSLRTLRERLAGRRQDSADVIERRMAKAAAEISHWDEFDYLIVNNRFSDALAALHSIIRKGQKPAEKYPGEHAKILAELLGKG
jgi:guanylate kinase